MRVMNLEPAMDLICLLFGAACWAATAGLARACAQLQAQGARP